MKLGDYIRKKGAILEFGDYYLSYRKELTALLEAYRNKDLKVAIWGAGLKGTAFLNTIDKNGKYIHIVIDMSTRLHGNYITSHHKVVSIEAGVKKKPDVILFMNTIHYADNLAILNGKNYKGIVVDLDYIIENRVAIQAVIENNVNFELGAPRYDLHKIHNRLIEVMMELDRICKKYGIQYFLSAGTALGAIRHKGFVPWDDDADVGMLREDFEKFRGLVETELGEAFYYQRMKKGSGFYRAHDQIVCRNTSYVQEHAKNIKMYHGIHVDIFPFDYVSENQEEREQQVRSVQIYRNKVYQKLVPHLTNTRNPVKRFFINFEYYKLKLVPFNYIYSKMEQSLRGYRGTNREYVADLMTHYKKIMYFRKSDIYPVSYVDFENIKLPVPNNYDTYLRMMYGDYMTPPPEGKRYQRHRLIDLSCEKAYYKDEQWFGRKND